METNEINNEKPVEHFLDNDNDGNKLNEEFEKTLNISGDIRDELETVAKLDRELGLVQLELLKQIRIILKESELDFEKLGALIDTYEIIFGGIEG
jgi:hypothetical protein